MSLIDEAFAGLKSNLEITATEQQLAQNRHKLIRDHIRASWALTDDFLTGSYDRHTKTKRLKDVDLFVVIDPTGPQAHLADGSGTAAVKALADVLRTRWPDVSTDETVVTVAYAGEDVASYEIAPAFAADNGYVIPNGRDWMATNPHEHARMVTAKNKDCDSKFVPLVKMVKGMNREASEPLQPSFLIEVMAMELVEPPMGRYPDEIRFFLASAADQITADWPDPAGLGNDANASSSAGQRNTQAQTVRTWLADIEEALMLEDDGKERAAVAKWRGLFSNRMPNV